MEFFFLFLALLIQKLDPEKHGLFLAKQRANAKALDQDFEEKKNGSCSKEQIHVSYFFKPHVVLMSLYITEENWL